MNTKTNLEQLSFDSDDELYFAHWLNELQQAGYITSWERDCETIILTEGLPHYWTETKVLKTKTKIETKTQWLLRGSVYTPDFFITWSSLAYNNPGLWQTLYTKSKITAPFIAHDFSGDTVSYVEIKPSFDRNNMTRAFVMNQKFIWQQYRKFINLIHITELFAETFTPTAFLFTPTGKPRKVNHRVRTLEEYIKTKQ